MDRGPAGASRGADRPVALGIAGLEPLPGKVNYFLGSDPALWRRDVPTYARVKMASIYQGIDLVYYQGSAPGGRPALEHDFVVAPGGDPGRIALEISGADSVTLEP